MNNNKTGISLNKFISDSGYCSRREADLYIESGMVLLNGKDAKKTDRVFIGDKVVVSGKVIKHKPAEKTVIVLLNKPKGINCTTDRKIKNNVLDYIGYAKKLTPISKLDKSSEGLILLTNDAFLSKKIAAKIETESVVTVNKAITSDFIENLKKGVTPDKKYNNIINALKHNSNEFSIIIKKEENRQIRRMCQQLGYYVRTLVKVRIGMLDWQTLPYGKWRFLNTNEIIELENFVSEEEVNKHQKKRIGKSKPKG